MSFRCVEQCVFLRGVDDQRCRRHDRPFAGDPVEVVQAHPGIHPRRVHAPCRPHATQPARACLPSALTSPCRQAPRRGAWQGAWSAAPPRARAPLRPRPWSTSMMRCSCAPSARPVTAARYECMARAQLRTDRADWFPLAARQAGASDRSVTDSATGSVNPRYTPAGCAAWNWISMKWSTASFQNVPEIRIATEPAMPATVIAARTGRRSRLRRIIRCAGVARRPRPSRSSSNGRNSAGAGGRSASAGLSVTTPRIAASVPPNPATSATSDPVTTTQGARMVIEFGEAEKFGVQRRDDPPKPSCRATIRR